MPPINSADLSAIANYAGKYEKRLFATLFNSMDVLKDITLIPNLKSKLQMTKLKVTDGPRPYTGDYNAKSGDLQFLPHALEVDRWQRDVNIHPDDFRGTFLEEYMGSGSNPNNKKIPFAQYVWKKVIGRLAADINDRVAFHGLKKSTFAAYNSANTYVSGDRVYATVNNQVRYFIANQAVAAGESPSTTPAKWDDKTVEAITPGFKQLISDAITASSISEVAIGTIDNSTVFAYAAFTALWRSLPEAYRKNGATIYCSFTDAELLMDDLEDKVAKFTRMDVSGEIFYLPKTYRKAIIKPCTWMNNSRRIIVTPKANLLAGTDKQSDLNTISTIEQHYHIEASMSGLLGFQVRDWDAMVINDQA